ncbi:unnamed protein product [Peronospora effusa]|uniref:Transmembrane protein n=1 Tax=Peronospora effusa TaxID=542832 RepID=A0A425CIZ7_9STRA|nr:hypothetical protein DD237_001508 [Peronospora effusa]CAI5706378.1 unnamed protein product [Peronospora effusa]
MNATTRLTEENRPIVVAMADFRGTNPIIDGDFLEKEVACIPTLDEHGDIDVTSSRYKKAVDTATRNAPAREALSARSTRSRDSCNLILPTRNQTLEFQEEIDESECEDQHKEDERKSRHQDVPHTLQNQSRDGSRKVNAWMCCGHSYPNAFLRLCTGVVLVSLVVCGLIFWPVLAASVLTTILLCVCCYEHAWLSFRIHSQLLATYQWYEGNEGPEDDIVPSTRSDASLVYGYQGGTHFNNASSLTQSSTSVSRGLTALGHPIVEAEAAIRPKVPSGMYLLELETPSGVLGMANYLFHGNLWLARIVVAAMSTVCWSIAATKVFPLISFPVASTPSDISSAPYYFWLVNFVASLCAVSCPTWARAISLVVQKTAFEVMLLNALNCPLAASVNCSAAPITSLQCFALGAMALIMVHSLSARGPANLVVGVILDLLGYAYIAGTLGLLITMVNASDRKSTWATIWIGMLIATWVAQFAGYGCTVIMSHFQLPHMRLLPPHIVIALDVEASVCAIAASSIVLIFGEAVLNVPGGVLPKVLFSTGIVLMGRIGWLVILLLKEAAGVRWSGRIMPGFGGALDGAHVLLFTSIVFVKYYMFIIVQQTSEMDNQSGNGDSAPWTGVTFSTDLSR